MAAPQNIHVACRIVGPLETNCWILSCSNTRKAVIIDPGGDPDIIEAFVAEKRLEPVAIVCTHGHSDHIASVADLKARYRVPFAIHGDDLRIVKLSVREAPFWGFGRIEEPTVDRVLAAGEEIAFGRASGTILHTPGHTPGGISIRFDGFVVVGDTLFNRSIGRTDFEGGDLETLLASIRRELFTLPDETVVLCGHGPRTTIGEEKRENPFLDGSLA
jgi:hydroxyacylglutathione hydrolase